MSTPVTDGLPTRMRATNADRDQVAALIDGSVANGSLSAEEGAERVGFVRSAVYRDEFDALLADLPIAQSAPVVATASAPSALSAQSRSRVGAFVAAHRVWSWIIAAIVVLLVVAGGVLAATDGFGGEHGGGHDRGGSHSDTQHDGHR